MPSFWNYIWWVWMTYLQCNHGQRIQKIWLQQTLFSIFVSNFVVGICNTWLVNRWSTWPFSNTQLYLVYAFSHYVLYLEMPLQSVVSVLYMCMLVMIVRISYDLMELAIERKYQLCFVEMLFSMWVLFSILFFIVSWKAMMISLVLVNPPLGSWIKCQLHIFTRLIKVLFG